MSNGQMKGTEAKNEEKWRAWSVVESDKDSERERERGRRKSTGKKNRRGKRREGGPVGDRLRKEGRPGRNWQKSREKGEKTKLQNRKELDFSPNSDSHSSAAFDFCFLT